MTTALIGKDGATVAKARVAVVARTASSAVIAHLASAGHEVHECTDWDQFDANRRLAPFDLVLVDAATAGEPPTGLDAPAIALADHGGLPVAGAEAALEPILAMAVELRLANQRRNELENLLGNVVAGTALVGKGPVMRRLHGVIARAADCDATMLIEGPAGSGKSLAARIVHCKSRRSIRPIVVVDGGAIDAEGLTSCLARAQATTLVIEDIERLPPAAQAALVRHLKERASPRGGNAPRLITTTAAHLPELVARGAFREDLYYRLNNFPMVMPALRERLDDIPAIAEAILGQGAATSGRGPVGITPAALMLLESMPWPGNVAQLEAVLKRAQAMAGGVAVDREHILSQPVPVAVQGQVAGTESRPAANEELTEESIRPFEEEEQMLLSRALRATKGNVRRAAQLLGIGRATLYRKIQQYKLRLQ